MRDRLCPKTGEAEAVDQTAHYWDVYRDLNRQVKEAFDARGLTIPFPQTEMRIKGDAKAAHLASRDQAAMSFCEGMPHPGWTLGSIAHVVVPE